MAKDKSSTKKQKEVTELDILKNIEVKIDKLTGVMAIQGKEQDIQIKILTGLGYSSTEIALLVGTTPGNVRTRISRTKSKSSKSAKKKSSKSKS